MNWRALTAINAAIALVTVGAVIFDLTRPRAERSRSERQVAGVGSRTANHQSQGSAREVVYIASTEDLANARVDDLGAIPSATLTDLLRRATPDQRAALALKFNEAPTDARTFGGMAVFFQAWTELDPEAAIAGAFQINDVAMRRVAARTVIGSISPSAASELIAFVTEHPDKDLASECKGEFLGGLISTWSQLDPAAASQYIDQLGDSAGNYVNGKARSDIAYNWATLDPPGALEWIAKQKGKDFVESDGLYDSAVRGWCRIDTNAASAYVAQHLNESFASEASSSVVDVMLDHDAGDATVWVSQLPAGDARNSAESEMASQLSGKDPAAAAKWAATLPIDDQASVVNTIMYSWRDSDWPSASRWIATLTGDARDQALAVAVNREGATPPESLLTALSIGDEGTRNNSIENVIRYWAANDPAAAESWVNGSPLSTEQRNSLRSVISEAKQAGTAEVERH